MISLTEHLGVPPELARQFHLACARFGHRPYITGIDVGRRMRRGRRTDELCLRIHVKEKIGAKLLTARERLPRKLGGVPIDVIQARYARHAAVAVAPAAGAAIAPGIAIRNSRGTNGTLGAFVANQAGDRFLLSAGHVLAPHDALSPGDIVRADDGALIAEAQNEHLLTDSAIAKLQPGLAPSPAVLGSGVTFQGVAYPQQGDVLEKSGAVTGVTRARVEGFGKYGDGNIDGVGLAFRLVPLDPNQEALISDFGDSGAVWYTTADGPVRKGIGLHVKGNPDQNPHDQYAVATMLPSICTALGVSLI